MGEDGEKTCADYLDLSGVSSLRLYSSAVVSLTSWEDRWWNLYVAFSQRGLSARVRVSPKCFWRVSVSWCKPLPRRARCYASNVPILL